MRIVFMGTPEFAVPSLRALIEAGHEIAGVFTQPDKPKGRGYQLTPPPVKELAMAYSLPVFQPQTLKTDEAKAQVSSLHPDLIAVVAYGKILPKEVLDCPPLGCVNVHGSLLPKYRGAGPIQWSVLNGEAVTGVTTMYMAEGLDTGDMILKRETPIGPDETADELHDRLAEIGAGAYRNRPVDRGGNSPPHPSGRRGSFLCAHAQPGAFAHRLYKTCIQRSQSDPGAVLLALRLHHSGGENAESLPLPSGGGSRRNSRRAFGRQAPACVLRRRPCSGTFGGSAPGLQAHGRAGFSAGQKASKGNGVLLLTYRKERTVCRCM